MCLKTCLVKSKATFKIDYMLYLLIDDLAVITVMLEEWEGWSWMDCLIFLFCITAHLLGTCNT